MANPVGVHLVGSIPYENEEEVWNKIFSSLPDRCSMVPDGETGERIQFVLWQRTRFPKETLSQVVARFPPANDYPGNLQQIPSTGYDTAAIESYQAFRRRRSEGRIPSNVRFQVNIPGPFDSVYGCVSPQYLADAFDIYEQRLLADVKHLQEEIPHKDLAVQLDLAVEIGFLEWSKGPIEDAMYQSFLKPFWLTSDAVASYPEVKEFTVDAVLRLAKAVEPDVALGFHLCYGDMNHKHFMQPKDTGVIVDLINDIARQLKSADRLIEWIHLPMPKGRRDVAYLEPLKQLDIGEAKIFLGLVHGHDEKGTRERVEAARAVLDRPWGVATECGLGRTPQEELDSIFAISAAVSAPIS